MGRRSEHGLAPLGDCEPTTCMQCGEPIIVALARLDGVEEDAWVDPKMDPGSWEICLPAGCFYHEPRPFIPNLTDTVATVAWLEPETP